MGWKDQLREASFKGVPIKWISLEGENGRRVAEHEFPQRDKPWVEDMGRATRPYRFMAVCCGEDWLQQLNTLLAVLEEPGAGELVHPLFGRVTVYAKPAHWSLNLDVGGRVDIPLEFIENGDLLFPVPLASTAAPLQSASGDMLTASQSVAEQALAALDLARAVVGDVVTAVMSAIKGVSNAVEAVLDYFDSWQSLVNTVLTLPATAVGKVLSILESVDRAFDRYGDLTRWGINQSRAMRVLRARSKALSKRSNGTVSTKVAAVLVGLMATGVTANTLQAVSTLPTSRPADGGNLPVAADVASLRQDLSGSLWAMADGAGYEQAAYLLVVQRAAVAHLNQVEAIGLQLQTFTPPAVMPALVLAYRAQGDASLADELLSRNNIVHPLFVPVQELQVTYD
jgi:prophage DNA circulation protein